jgi:phospholipase/lecithinase/hemolysin
MVRFAGGILLFGLVAFPARATFSSIYIFGDGICTTTTNLVAGPTYYGLRNSNGRVWVEVLAQQLGLTNNYWYSTNSSIHVSYTNLSASSTNWSYSSNNSSYYGQHSSNLVTNLKTFTAPTDASNALFIVWVNDADFVGDMGSIYLGGYGTNITKWTNAINLSLTNHYTILTNLYAKGARTLIMPNAVDITEIPEYDNSPSADKNFIRQRVIGFNSAFTTLLSNAMVSLPGLKIYEPDVFTLLNNVLTNASYYGLTNVLYNGQSADVVEDDADTSLNGSGTNWIFWDTSDPTAKFHAVFAGVVQQLLSPVQISKLTSLNSSNQLDMANIPIGRNGFINSSTDLVNWTSMTNISSTNATETILVPTSGPQQFYQLSFPFAWSWP